MFFQRNVVKKSNTKSNARCEHFLYLIQIKKVQSNIFCHYQKSSQHHNLEGVINNEELLFENERYCKKRKRLQHSGFASCPQPYY